MCARELSTRRHERGLTAPTGDEGGREGEGQQATAESVSPSVGPSVAFDFINLNFEKFAEREAAGKKGGGAGRMPGVDMF